MSPSSSPGHLQVHRPERLGWSQSPCWTLAGLLKALLCSLQAPLSHTEMQVLPVRSLGIIEGQLLGARLAYRATVLSVLGLPRPKTSS